MDRKTSLTSALAGAFFGMIAGLALLGGPRPVTAANDRIDGSIICTGAAGVNPRSPLDGVWLLDAKSGRLLATIVDRAAGKIVGFAEVDVAKEFGLPSAQAGQFMMTTGTIAMAQSALYLAETTTGKFAVYTMGPSTEGVAGVTILRHDMTSFRRDGR